MELSPNFLAEPTLRAAQARPDEYGQLMVRLFGLSARFVDLSPAVQESAIERVCASPELRLSRDGCRSCLACQTACPRGEAWDAQADGPVRPLSCDACGACAAVCSVEARRVAGAWMSVGDLAAAAVGQLPYLAEVHAPAELRRMAALLAALPSPPPVRLLPYHRLGEGKWRALGRAAPPFAPPPAERVTAAAALFVEQGLSVIG